MESLTSSSSGEEKKKDYPIYHFERNEILILLAIFFTSLSFANFSPYAPVYLKEIFSVNSYLALGAISIITNAMIVVGTPIWGRLADIFQPKKFVLLGIGSLSLMYFSLVFSNSSTFFLIVIFIGFLFGSAQTGNIYALATKSTKKTKEVVLSKISIVMSLSWLIMSPIAGKIFDTMDNSYKIQMSIASISCLISLLIVLFVKEYKEQEQEKEKTDVNSLKDKEKITEFVTPFVIFIALSFVFQAASGGFWSFNTLYFIDFLEIKARVYSNFLVVVTILGIFVSYLLGKVKTDFKNAILIMIFSLIQVVIFGIMTFNPYNSVLNLILYSVPMYPIYNISFYWIVTSLSNEKRRATAYGIFNSIGILGIIAGVILLGIVADKSLIIISMLKISFYISIVAFIFSIALFVFIKKHVGTKQKQI
ncbi:MAG: MFS transporter [Candidatus Heimdallarchaeum endolithica]|uniref:MFS transporter n=1 Tax=Candidatus Heimdallarchaeum endolithica TaxID=2876572 RepID=A0A9Y1FPJ6_9ARCH|nr:MAG: MFS transporter [Candidatus Heimdallarchaeum endolithica]